MVSGAAQGRGPSTAFGRERPHYAQDDKADAGRCASAQVSVQNKAANPSASPGQALGHRAPEDSAAEVRRIASRTIRLIGLGSGVPQG